MRSFNDSAGWLERQPSVAVCDGGSHSVGSAREKGTVAKTVDEGFRTLLRRLTPTTGDTARAKKHRQSIETCLKNEFSITRFFRIGSFGNGTSIHGYSDVDYLAEFPKRHVPRDSDDLLSKVCRALDARFPRTGVEVDAPAVVVPFGDDKSEWTEVVPADRAGNTKLGYPLYRIPDGGGGWRKSSPESHNAYVAGVDSKKSGKVKPLIRFIKAWSFFHGVGLSSFYLELFTAKYAAEESTILYSMDVLGVFEKLYECGLASIPDPRGISGEVEACGLLRKFFGATDAVEQAVEWARKARKAEREERFADAFKWWDKVYAGKFPSRY